MKLALTHVDLPNQSKGGVANQVHHFANTLVGRGHEVTMFTFSPAYEDCRYQVHQYAKRPSRKKIQSYLFAVQLARTDFSGFDVLHVNGDNYLLRGRHPQARTFYGSARDEAESALSLPRRLHQRVMAHLETRGARVADVNVGISEATRARIPAITRIIPCGVDTSRFSPGPKAERPTLLFVGTTGGRKRGAFLADIFGREIRPRFPEAQMWTVSDKPMEGEGIVNFGRVSFAHLTELFQQAWVFCLPSTYEGFGVPYIEAMAAGTPVVASPNPGAREVLGEGRFGVLAEDACLGEQINLLLGDAAGREEYIARGLARAQDFAWARVAEQYEALFASLAARTPTSKNPGREKQQAMTRILCINTAGKGDLHELRARRLSTFLRADVTLFSPNKSDSRRIASQEIKQLLTTSRWDLVYQESTGISGGLNLIRAARTRRQPFIVSSGDPISGYFRVTRGPVATLPFAWYEKALYRASAGFVGWTPYLTGRALHLGAPRGVTIEGSVDLDIFRPFAAMERAAIRAKYELPTHHLVCGIVGSLNWRPKQAYCYGLELIETLKHLKRQDVSLLIVGDGKGKAMLEQAIPESLKSRVVFTGRIPPDEVVGAMNAMDIGFITQTLDELGSYRLTTKLPEYLACGLPVAMSPIPGYFDYVGNAGWPLPPFHPASSEFQVHCARWLDALSPDEVRARACEARAAAERHFDYQMTGPRFRTFVESLLDAGTARS